MPEPRPEAQREPRRDVDDFTRSVHASYLSRWLRHDPEGLEQAAEKPAAAKRRRTGRTSAA